MDCITELARAKVNLTLSIAGRRGDGYHEIESLVAFADLADVVRFYPGRARSLAVDGPFATAIEGDNLVVRVLDLVSALGVGATLGAVELTKSLPVAAGLGGGSADAAALLRAVLQANPELRSKIDVPALVARLGADVAVCFSSRGAVIWGTGARVALIPGLPRLPVVFVNPQPAPVPSKTANVYRALAAPQLASSRPRPDLCGPFSGSADVADHIRRVGNGLEAAALKLMPSIGEAKAAVSACEGCLAASMSGSGPTCFGVFESAVAAAAAAASLSHRRAQWWIAATSLGDGA